MRSSLRSFLGAVCVLADAAAVISAVCFSYWVRFTVFESPKGIPRFGHYAQALPIVCLVVLMLLRRAGLYDPAQTHRVTFESAWRIMKAVTLSLAVLLAATFFYREFSFSRAMFFIYWVSSVAWLVAFRVVVVWAAPRLAGSRLKPRRLLAVGWGSLAASFVEKLHAHPEWHYQLVGCVIQSREMPPASLPVLGTLEQFPQIVADHNIEEVLLTRPDLPRQDVLALILECEKVMVPFRLVADLLSMATTHVDIQDLDGIPVLSLKESPLHQVSNRVLKRTIDLVLATIGLVVLSPLMALLALLIKLDSRGPVLYAQERVGEDGRVFTMYKFRTMVQDAERQTGPVWATPEDARRTRLGRWLRRDNLDELPQLINVVKGQMSLVGPRPERPHFVNQFKESVPRYMARHKIKSGVTGWAQVNGLRGDTSVEERTQYDLYYLENWSPLLDLKILLKSFTATKNAY